jgi:predicted polyphosphate/ATP-dependent NAD kinase
MDVRIRTQHIEAMMMSPKKKLGLIVNPIAGMGGRVGLKGTDGRDILDAAKKLGAVPNSPTRTVEALRRVDQIKDRIQLLTYPSDMGEDEAKECSFEPVVLGSITIGSTTSADTRNASRDMMHAGVDLILFAGGDGTARDICEAIGDRVPVLGIPSGVKIHSAVFATNPRNAGDLAVLFLREAASLREGEVMDVDEQAFRENRLSAKLFGYLKVPYEQSMVQATKSSSPEDEEGAPEGIASDFIEDMQDDCAYIIGPGTTTQAIMKELGLKKTLLGVDLVYNRRMLASDVSEKQISEMTQGKNAKIVVSIIGGQGFIFGRGSQQISPDVIRRVGRENVIVVATPNKLASLRGRPLLVDTGDSEVDSMLTGYIQVITDYRRRAVFPVRSG